MKRYLIAVFCLLTACTFVFAQEPAAPSVPAPALPGNVPPQAPAGVLPSAPPNAQPGAPANLPQALPPGVTPEQIRTFLQKPKEENYIILNFDNADLRDVINTVSSITKENFIISPGVDARITIHSAKKIPVSEVMNVFESVLEANGISLVRSGEFYKVIHGAAAKQKPLEVRKGGQPEGIPAVDRMVTQIVPVQYVPASEVTMVLTPLLSQFGGIIPNPRNNLLIINDLSSNIKRLLTILGEIDVNAFQNSRMLFFKPSFSDVVTLTDELTEVLNALNITKDGISFMPLERINSLIVFSSSASLLGAVEAWLKKLDEEIVSGQNVFIYHVQNVKAESIAEILDSLYGEDGGVKKVAARQAQADSRKKAPAPAQPAHQPGAKGVSGSNVEIITFEPTNSLIILAPPGIYREMAEMIKKIDTYPREVLIEGIVAQVTLTDTDEYGIQWSVLRNIDIDSKDYNGLIRNSIGNLVTSAPGFNSGAAGGLSVVLFRPDKLSALLNLLSQRSKVKVLQSPRLLVRDQEEASIEVGSEVPTATSSTTSAEATTTTQSIQYKTVGIKLKIKPTINEEKTVVLDLEQEVSSQGDDVRIGPAGNTFPSFNTTKTKTSIVVPNEHGIIIGGIIDETKDKSYQGIPFLSSIPVLGGLFRYQTDTITKKELVIIITPHVLVSKTEGEIITDEFVGKLKEVKTYLDEKDIEYKKPHMPGAPAGSLEPALKQ
ncbi:MAG: type II secretion system protein GspD [Nitrospiraceae bacterium]|nr:MAG: type II secretion system protein GspD [Nitrospiraceae bacterium]